MKLKHSVYDTDTHFSINPATRELINESLQKTSLIQYDHNCERFTFALPRTIEGHDMSKCDIVQVHYLNVDAQTKAQSKGVYEVDDMQISPDGDDVVICSWLIPSTATEYVGSLSFLLRFCCIAADGRTLSYAWHTAIYSGIAVSNGIYNGDIVSEEFPEILVDWQKELQANMIANVEQTQKSAADGGLNVWTMTMGDGRAFDFRVYNGRAGDVTVVQQAPQFVGSIEECTDPTRLYVLPDGHIYHYRDTTIVHPAEQETRGIQVLDRYGLFVTDHQVQRSRVDHHCATDWVDLSNVPRPCHINLKGIRWGNRSATNYVSAYWAAFTSTGNYSASNLVNGSAVTPLSPDNTADYKIVNNNDTYTDVTVTIKSDKVKMVAFAGVYASSEETDADGKGGAGSYDTAEAVLYYNVSEETTETWHGWYDTGHVFSGSAGVSVQQIVESPEDGGANVVHFTDGTSLTVLNGSRGSSPVKGVDYFTAADKQSIVDEVMEVLPGGDQKDIPKVFFGSPLPQIKSDTIMGFRYTSATADLEGFCITKAQGNSSMSYPKKNQTVKIYKDAECTQALKLNLKGWGGQNKYCFKANWTDLSHARNVVSARLWGDMVKTRDNFDALPERLRHSPNFGAIDGFPVKVFAAGKYQGRYTLNIPKDKWLTNMDASLAKHCILCGENYASACFRASANIDGTDWSDEIHDTVPDTIKTRWNEVIAFVMNSTDEEFVQNLHTYFDINSLIDYYIFGLVSCNLDGFGKNQLYITYDGSKWFASVYDMDATWGLDCNSLTFMAHDFPRSAYQDMIQGEGNLLYIRLAQLFVAEIQARWEVVRRGALSIANIINRFERFTDIAPGSLIEEDYAETTADGAFTGIPLKDTNNIQQLRAYALARLDYVNGVLMPHERPNLWSLTDKTEYVVADGHTAATALPLDYSHYYYPINRGGAKGWTPYSDVVPTGEDVAISAIPSTDQYAYGYGVAVPVRVESGKTYKLSYTLEGQKGDCNILYYDENRVYATVTRLTNSSTNTVGDKEFEFIPQNHPYALVHFCITQDASFTTPVPAVFKNINLVEV